MNAGIAYTIPIASKSAPQPDTQVTLRSHTRYPATHLNFLPAASAPRPSRCPAPQGKGTGRADVGRYFPAEASCHTESVNPIFPLPAGQGEETPDSA